MRNNQKGFSMIELIVTIAIMAVVTTGGVLSFSLVTGRQVIGCTEEIVSYISQTKVQALSRADAQLEIFVKNDGVYVNLSVEGRDVKVGKSGLQVKYKTQNGAEMTLSETDRLKLTFDRSSGAFLALADGTVDGSYCVEITVENGRHSRTIILVPQTGKYYVEE